VLLTHGGHRALLADFGVACQVEHTEDLRRSIVGTPAFMSPEMLEGRPYGLSYSEEEGLLFVVSQSLVGEARGFTVSLQDPQYAYDVEWTPANKAFNEPHDIAVAPGGRLAYVGFIDRSMPNKVWRFYSN